MKIKLALLYCFLFTFMMKAQSPPPENEASKRYRAEIIHKSVITIDTHDDIDVSNFTAEVNYSSDLDTQVNIPKMIEGGLDVSFLVVYTAQGDLDKKGYKKALDNALAKFDAIHRLVDIYAPDQIGLALSAADVKRIHASGKKVAMIGVENAYPIGEDLSLIEDFYNRGARYMSLAHNGHNQLSDSHTGEQDDIYLNKGLSKLGKKAVAEMNRLGIMVDLSHPSKEANIQMIKLSKAPVIASHSSARAVSDASRNLDDELLMMIKENGGVVQTVAVSEFLNADKLAKNEEASAEIYQEIATEMGISYLPMSAIMALPQEQAENAWSNYEKIVKAAAPKKTEINKKFPLVNVSDFVDHIDYMVNLIGVDHVGICSDFDGGGGIDGWSDASESFNVTYELVRRGYSEEDIAKLWGLNLLRVLEEVENVAKEIQLSSPQKMKS